MKHKLQSRLVGDLAVSMIHQMLAIWSLVPLPFLKPAWTSGSSWFTYCWSLAWRILSITLLACEMSALCRSLSILWHCLLWDWNENWPFPVLWPLLSFPNLLAYWVQHFHTIIFQDWNSSTGIPSPPLALFVMMLSYLVIAKDWFPMPALFLIYQLVLGILL